MIKPLKELRIIFMGTPDFAVASLEKLVDAGLNIVAVVTAPDKPAGRGMQIQKSAVKQFAESHRLNILQPEKLKDPEFIQTLASLKADVQVVVAFRMLPEKVWNMPPMGTINVHGSLLPQYRGAAPINWAIINGEKYTGVTTFKLKHEIDTGDILLSQRITIGEDDTAGEIHDKMKVEGANLLLQTLQGITEQTLVEKPQSSLTSAASSVRHAPKIFTDTCRIDWTKPKDDIYNLIRGLAPYPGAFTFLEEKQVKIFKAEKINDHPEKEPGAFTTDKKTFLRYACTDGYINILELQMQGKKKMEIKDFLRGYHFKT